MSVELLVVQYNQDLRIDDVWEDLDVQMSHGNDVRGCSSSAGTFATNNSRREIGPVRVADNADCKRAANEEDAEANVHCLEGSLDVVAPGETELAAAQ